MSRGRHRIVPEGPRYVNTPLRLPDTPYPLYQTPREEKKKGKPALHTSDEKKGTLRPAAWSGPRGGRPRIFPDFAAN